ncbi:MAG: response regulator transcription factor [Deltaproteobacteria bacterium]|nr:response regulator transcription factor [Deltaproteobacteria bacterium]
MTTRVLLIDDDHRLFELLSTYLDANGCTLDHAADGPRGLAKLAASTYDLALLDLMMPGMDGLEVLRRIRAKDTVPVIVLTAKGDETDRVVGLELGADDYLPKPFGPRELLARIRAVLRRAQPDAVGKKLSAGDLEVDVDRREAKRGGRIVDLTALEFDILVALVRRAGRVIPRDGVLQAAGRGDIVVSERTVDVHISHLRAKLGDDPKTPTLIKTVRGVGYTLVKPE